MSTNSSGTSSSSSSSNVGSEDGSGDNEAPNSESDSLAEYNALVAEAWRIHNKHYPTAIEQTENDSDSELSVLASSLFNCMEGNDAGQMEGIEKVAPARFRAKEVALCLYWIVAGKQRPHGTAGCSRRRLRLVGNSLRKMGGSPDILKIDIKLYI